jgi:hypothetical protein
MDKSWGRKAGSASSADLSLLVLQNAFLNLFRNTVLALAIELSLEHGSSCDSFHRIPLEL